MNTIVKDNWDRILEALKNDYGISYVSFNTWLSPLKLYDETNDDKLVSAFVLDFISKTIERLTKNLRAKYENEQIIYAGGVMSNSIIQENIRSKFKNVYFAKPEFSSDNASGIALLTRMKYLNKEV
jgi:N6-L-threonylcarbamoyladenine synthase